MSGGKWIIASNRLPFSYDPKQNRILPSSGGLVTAIKGIGPALPFTWVGAITDDTPLELFSNSITKEKQQNEYIPVTLSQSLYDNYYNGLCNDVLWPLFHYESNYVNFSPDNWKAYEEVNEKFCDSIIEVANDGDLVWIHDFHLLLLPGLLKKFNPKIKVGFFLHIPFPSSEIFKQFPRREAVLESLISSDLIGFHDYSYLRHFCSSVQSLLGIQSSLLTIENDHHQTHLGVYPVSIGTQSFVTSANSEKTTKMIKKFDLEGQKKLVILGVDRMDYIKGIELKLKAFRELLIKYPQLRERVRFLQITVPSRTKVGQYIELKNEIEKLVGDINGEFSTPNCIPVQYIFNSVDFHELLALYRTSQVLFIGSKRDGMNLVCLEYVASQDLDNPGVVVLSEFAGAVSTLAHALPINPWDIEQTADTLHEALTMPSSERKKRHRPMFDFLNSYTAGHWAASFMKDLNEQGQKVFTHTPHDLSREIVLQDVLQKLYKKKIFILLNCDYFFHSNSLEDHPEKQCPILQIKSLLKRLNHHLNLDFILISTLSSSYLEEHLKNLDLYMVSENGAEFYDPKIKKWKTLVNTSKKTWHKDALKIIKDYALRTPASFIEDRDFSISWNYRKSPREFGDFQARNLFMELETELSHYPVSVLFEKKMIEVRSMEAEKSIFANWFKNNYCHEKECTIVAIGEDPTDEDLFRVLEGKEDLTVKVGPGPTGAKYRLLSLKDLFPFLLSIENLLTNRLF